MQNWPKGFRISNEPLCACVCGSHWFYNLIVSEALMGVNGRQIRQQVYGNPILMK